jgi:hypothetical protein
MLVSPVTYSSNLKIQATCSFETSVDFQRATRRYIPEDRTVQQYLYLHRRASILHLVLLSSCFMRVLHETHLHKVTQFSIFYRHSKFQDGILDAAVVAALSVSFKLVKLPLTIKVKLKSVKLSLCLTN